MGRVGLWLSESRRRRSAMACGISAGIRQPHDDRFIGRFARVPIPAECVPRNVPQRCEQRGVHRKRTQPRGWAARELGTMFKQMRGHRIACWYAECERQVAHVNSSVVRR